MQGSFGMGSRSLINSQAQMFHNLNSKFMRASVMNNQRQQNKHQLRGAMNG
jgi:hypothetical protein